MKTERQINRCRRVHRFEYWCMIKPVIGFDGWLVSCDVAQFHRWRYLLHKAMIGYLCWHMSSLTRRAQFLHWDILRSRPDRPILRWYRRKGIAPIVPHITNTKLN